MGPQEIHPEQEDPLNVDEENDMIEGSLFNKSSSKNIDFYDILKKFSILDMARS